MNIEKMSFEFDPSYDPERLAGSSESEPSSETSPANPLPNVTHVDIPEYLFDSNSNPFAWDAKPQRPLTPIAHTIHAKLEQAYDTSAIIIRGVQSGHHTMSRDKLIDLILEQGHDAHTNQEEEGELQLYAREYDNEAVESIMEGFHMYKPKSDELPQFPIDIWMIFDKNHFENIEYIHPRHKIIARDKWLSKRPSPALMGVLVVN